MTRAAKCSKSYPIRPLSLPLLFRHTSSHGAIDTFEILLKIDPLLSRKCPRNVTFLLLSSVEWWLIHMPRDNRTKEWAEIEAALSDSPPWPVHLCRRGGQAGLGEGWRQGLQSHLQKILNLYASWALHIDGLNFHTEFLLFLKYRYTHYFGK